MTPDSAAQRRVGREDWIFLSSVLLAGLIPVVGVLLHQGVWGVEPTLGLVMVLYASSVLAIGVVTALHRWRRARVH